MDRKAIIVLSISFLLLVAWYPLMQQLGYIQPAPLRTNQLGQVRTNGPASGTSGPPVQAELRPAPATPPDPAVPPPPGSIPAAFAGPETTLTLSNSVAQYTFTSRGGGLRRVDLLKYPETIERRRKGMPPSSGGVAALNEGAPVPALALLGDPALEGDGDFTLTRIPDGVRAERALTNGLVLLKEFTLGSNYLLNAVVRVDNRSAGPQRIGVHDWVIGTATPMVGGNNPLLDGMQWYDGRKAHRIGDAWFANRTLGCIPGTPRTDYIEGATNVVWASVHNQFFTMVAVPSTNAERIVSHKIPLPLDPATVVDGKSPQPQHGYQAAFRFGDRVLAAGQSLEHRLQLYSGPKEYNTLAKLAVVMGNNLDLVMQFDGFFGWFAKALLLSMNGLNSMGLSYGLAIVAITVIIKLLFWPLTTASTKSMKRMAALQPQMKAIQDKYKEDPQKMNAKLMEFMRENKVSPLGGCLPLLLQIPVFFGFYSMLQSAIELRGARFLWAYDLSRADTIAVIPGIDFPINPLPLLMGVTMLWQARLTPPSPGMDPTQQKIMKYMPLMFMVFLYSFSAGLTLYWTVQNLLSILQMKLTRTDDPKAPASSPAPAPAPRPVPASGKKRNK